MGHAYIPGLTVASHSVVRRTRRLPLAGEILVRVGQHVAATDVVGRAVLPGALQPIDAAATLEIAPGELPARMCVPVGATVAQGAALARTRGIWGRFQRELRAPRPGTLESVSAITGQIMLRGPARRAERTAFVPGEVVAVEPNIAATIEARVGWVQGVFGVGGETFGPLETLEAARDEAFDEDQLQPAHAGKIVVTSGWLTAAAVHRARALGVRGLGAGGIDDADLRAVLGYDLGVAVTGDEDLGLTLMVTEGFGPLRMAPETFALLVEWQGRMASLCGATQIRAGVVRPELMVPSDDAARPADPVSPATGLAVGVRVRAVSGPALGRLGRCTALPGEPARLATGAWVRVLEVEFADGGRALLPHANVELIKP
jgi:hypothetical protein